jgi:hypothetical protein
MDDELSLNLYDIEDHDLDKEWSKQAKLYAYWGWQWADAKRDLDQAEDQLELTKAELDSDIRNEPEKFDIPKVTESAIKNAILAHPRHIEALKNLSKLKHNVNRLSIALTALDHKKKALENRVVLFCKNWEAEPRAPKEAREKWDKHTNETTVERISKKLNKKE